DFARGAGRRPDALQRAARKSRAAERGEVDRRGEEGLLRLRIRAMPEIQMPKRSDTMTEGTLVAWKKKKGDKVSAGDVIAEIETDKATMEWESPEDGTLSEIYVEEGGKVEVGQRIAFIGEEGEAAPKEEKKAPEKKQKKEEPPEKEAKKTEEAKREQAEAEKPASAKTKEKESAPPQE